MMAMDALQAIMSRRSVRSYTGSPISRQQRQIVSAGMQAPSAHGSSTWRFLTITDRAAMRGSSRTALGGAAGQSRRPDRGLYRSKGIYEYFP